MAAENPRITVQPNGPYVVTGSVPLAVRHPVLSEHEERLTWRTGERLEADETYALCRCGGSSTKPFCDGTHAREGFDGTESAPTETYRERQRTYVGTGIEVHDDRGICEHAGFCGNKRSNVWKMTREESEDTQVRAQVMAMVERCPSGALTYEVEGEPVEPELPVEVAVVPGGPLWVTGGVPVQRADGEPLETRNRMALCRCGHSAIKPLCDGSHARVGFQG